MRVLITLLHVHPMIPLARELRDAGHEVLFACAAGDGLVVERLGFRSEPAGGFRDRGMPQIIAAELEREAAEGSAVPSLIPGSREWVTAQVFGGALPAAMAADVVALCERWRPDVIVRDSTEFGGNIAAEVLGIPHASVQVGAHSNMFTALPPFRQAFVAAQTRARAAVGLQPDPALKALYPHLHLSYTPPSYDALAAPLPETTRHLRTIVFDQSGDEALPAWVAQLPERPTVHVTLGTAIFNRTPGVFEAILAGLGGEELNVIATVGRGNDPAALGPQPPNVHVEPYIPQSLLYPRCDVVFAHGGWNTAMAALTHGLPLVVVPLGADQPENARCLHAIGAGRVLPFDELRPESARAALLDVLGEPSYRAAARRTQAEIAALPGPEMAVSLLEELVARS